METLFTPSNSKHKNDTKVTHLHVGAKRAVELKRVTAMIVVFGNVYLTSVLQLTDHFIYVKA
jgi:hypothetical protein